MPEELRLILTSPPADAQGASSWGLPVGHIAYRVGPGARLLRANIPLQLRGGLMAVDSGGFEGRGDSAFFCQQVERECLSRGFDGVILDFEGGPQPTLCSIVEQLGRQLARRGWPLYVTAGYGSCSDQTRIMIPSALSGGSLKQRLMEAAEQFGPRRVALGVQRTAEDFTLPAANGSGIPLTQEELHRQVEAHRSSVFFSEDLCAYYFTYLSRQRGAHFVLFDTAASIVKKLELARQLNLCAALLAWPEVKDILPQILKVNRPLVHNT